MAVVIVSVAEPDHFCPVPALAPVVKNSGSGSDKFHYIFKNISVIFNGFQAKLLLHRLRLHNTRKSVSTKRRQSFGSAKYVLSSYFVAVKAACKKNHNNTTIDLKNLKSVCIL
jgi:hypothetical protein